MLSSYRVGVNQHFRSFIPFVGDPGTAFLSLPFCLRTLSKEYQDSHLKLILTLDTFR